MSWMMWTDGSSRGNPGPGGWGVIVVSPERVEEFGGRERMTTNNRMEIAALIEGLRQVPRGEDVTVYLDSQYVRRGATEWLTSWRRNGWRTSAKQPVENQDLWEAVGQILDERAGKTDFRYVPGHRGIPGNERADAIATGFADGTPPNLYRVLRSDYPHDLSASVPEIPSEEKGKPRKGKAYAYVSMVDGRIESDATWEACEKRVKGKKGARYKKVFSKEEEENLIAEWSS